VSAHVVSFDFPTSGEVIFEMLQLTFTPGRAGRTDFILSAAGGDTGIAARRPRVLVVEDDYFVALELEHHLIEAGYEVVGIAPSAEEALRIAAGERPDLAIMDIRLVGERDGVEVAIELASKFRIPSIFATAHADSQTRKRAEEAKPLGWVQKPYSPQTLIEHLRNFLKDHR
jgi:CheY-like chemotaxis protein